MLEVHTYPNRWKLLGFAVIGCLLTAGGAWVAMRPEVGVLKRAIAGFGVPFFAVCTIFLVKKLFDHRPSLSITALGIVDNTSAIKAGLIEWKDIVAVRIVEVSRQQILVIEVRDEDAYLARLGPVARMLARINLRAYGIAIAVPQSLVSIPLAQVMAHVEHVLGRAATRPSASIQPGPVMTLVQLIL